MDPADLQRKLVEADAHVADGMRYIAMQPGAIGGRARAGQAGPMCCTGLLETLAAYLRGTLLPEDHHDAKFVELHAADSGDSMDVRLSAIIGAIAIFSNSGVAVAQTPPWAVGTWKGAISNLRNDPKGPERVLVIGADGKCRWDYAAKMDAPSQSKSCAITADAVNLLTGGDATVQLQHKGGKLDGTFQSKGGNSFHVSFTKQ